MDSALRVDQSYCVSILNILEMNSMTLKGSAYEFIAAICDNLFDRHTVVFEKFIVLLLDSYILERSNQRN